MKFLLSFLLQKLGYLPWFVTHVSVLICQYWSFAVKEPHRRQKKRRPSTWSQSIVKEASQSESLADRTRHTTWSRSMQKLADRPASLEKVEASRSTFSKASQKGRSLALMFWWHTGSNFVNYTRLILLWEFIAGKNWSQLCPGRFLQHFLAELFSADFCNFSRPNFGNIFWPNFATFFRPNFATFFRPNFATIFWPTFATISWLYFATIFWPNFATFLL